MAELLYSAEVFRLEVFGCAFGYYFYFGVSDSGVGGRGVVRADVNGFVVVVGRPLSFFNFADCDLIVLCFGGSAHRKGFFEVVFFLAVPRGDHMIFVWELKVFDFEEFGTACGGDDVG